MTVEYVEKWLADMASSAKHREWMGKLNAARVLEFVQAKEEAGVGAYCVDELKELL